MGSEHESRDDFMYLNARPQNRRLHWERQRQHRFEKEELDILLREVQSLQPGPGYNGGAQATWEHIAAEVSSSSSGYIRTWIQCKKRYNDLLRRQPRSTRVVRRAKQNRLTKKKLRQLPRPSQEGHVVSVKKEVFKTEFDDAELNGEGTIGTFGDFQNEVGTKVLGVGPGNPRTTDLLDDEQTLDNAALSEANRVHPLITRTSQWPSLPTKNLQPRVNLVRLNLEHSSHNTPELIRGFHFSTPQNSPGPHVTAAPTTVQSQGNTPFDVNLPHFVPLSQQATVAQDNQSQAYTSQNNQSQAYTSQSNQAPADVPQSNHSYVRPRISASQVNPTPGHIPQIDIQPHIHVQSPPLDLTALVQIHHQGYNMLQRELVGMRSGIETMLQPLLSSINTNLERLVNAVERLSGVENKLQTDGGVRNQGSSPD